MTLSRDDALRLAVSLLRAERLDDADGMLGAFVAQAPDDPDGLQFLGVLRHAQGRVDDALALLRRAAALDPGRATIWNNLGNVLLLAGHVDDAAHAYRRSLAIVDADPAQGDGDDAGDPRLNLATVERQRGRLADAEALARQAIERRPDAGDAWYHLSLALMAQGRVHDGLMANSRAVALWPRAQQPREQVVRALVMLGERDEAARLYREWLAEEPDHPVIRHQLAAVLGDDAPGGVPARAADACMRQLFDAFASSFDAKLEMLGYRAPHLVADALGRLAGAPAAALDVCDAGCGTGLAGAAVRPWARRLAGCDLSVGMLRRAHARRVYDALHEAELVHYLDTQPGAFDAVVSADTLCYFGALDAALAAARRALRPGGMLVFTVEALPEGDVRPHALRPNGRYAHGGAHIDAALRGAGFGDARRDAATLRMEGGLPVDGWVVAARRAAPQP